MKLFLDSSNPTEAGFLMEDGLLEGITTNPTSMAKFGYSVDYGAKEICEYLKAIHPHSKIPVSVQCVSDDCPGGYLSQAKALWDISPLVVAKIPCTLNGIRALAMLPRYKANMPRYKNRGVNMTLCFSLQQAMLAGKFGAAYVSPFYCRTRDAKRDPYAFIEDIARLYRNEGYETEIIAASLRTVDDVVCAMQAGAHIATMNYKLFMEFLEPHPQTVEGYNRFLADYEEAVEKRGVKV